MSDRQYSVLIFGDPGSGKSHQALLTATEKPVLYITFGAISPEVPEDAEIFMVTEWEEFERNHVALLNSKEWGSIIIEALDLAVTQYTYSLTSGATLTQQQWGYVAPKMVNVINRARKKARRVIVTLGLKKDEASGVLTFAANADTMTKILPLFTRKMFCYTKPGLNKDGKIDRNVIQYLVNDETASSIRFVLI